jgi:glycosyltransferase involved in cell wall biosynthesis
MHRSAKRAYQGTDKISAVGQSYLELASRYLGQKTESRRQRADRSFAINHQSSSAKPMHLCYHGTDLDRFQQSRSEKVKRETCESKATLPSTYSHPSALIRQHSSLNKPLKAVYLGAMGTGYDLQTIIDVAARWKAENDFPVQIHFAGTGPQRETLEARATEFGLISHQSSSINHQSSSAQADLHQSSVINDSERIIFHGQLGRDAVNHLLSSADLAFVPNRSSSFVACPYKAGEYAAAGLPMLSCLRGELGRLLRKWNAGSEYNEGDAASLQATFEKYLTDLDLLKQQSLNAQEMAEALFDRKRTYPVLADFILH